MSFQTTPANSSRVTKPAHRRNKPLRRSASSPFAANPRTKPAANATRSKSTAAAAHESIYNEPLDDTGLVATLDADPELRDVPQFLRNIQSRMFSAVPERASGMNGQRTAEVLNFRVSLPPVVSIAHVHALSKSPTMTEREIAELQRKGVLRKVVVPGHGVGSAAVGEGLVLVSEWERLVQAHAGLDEDLKKKYLSLLHAQPTTPTVSAAQFSREELVILCSAGFLTAVSMLTGNADLLSRPGAATLGSMSSVAAVGSRGISGSLNAVGGADAFTASGASGGGQLYNASQKRSAGGMYSFALPNMGSYLRLLTSARTHLLGLLSKTSRFREAPMALLKERWDGGIAGADSGTAARRARGEFVGVLPGRTKKWKSFHGLSFEWVVEECVGSGLVELFQTRSVGVGVRAA